MSSRRRLPDRRAGETFEVEVAGLRYTATVSRFPDGSIAELFLSSHKSNSAADTNARDAAITFSIAVQHGADPEVIRRALCRDSHLGRSVPRSRLSRSRHHGPRLCCVRTKMLPSLTSSAPSLQDSAGFWSWRRPPPARP